MPRLPEKPYMEISIHALREEGDQPAARTPRCSPVFLSTPSARRATSVSSATRTHSSYFYPRPPRGGRRTNQAICQLGYQFLSTPSARRATSPDFAATVTIPISIHALREEGDAPIRQSVSSATNFYPRPPRGGRRVIVTPRWWTLYFYPRPPRGGRPAFWCRLRSVLEFLSTPSARRATRCFFVFAQSFVISIHALREEGDDLLTINFFQHFDFYPRPPRGGRHYVFCSWWAGKRISIHALREEGDRRNAVGRQYNGGFLSTPSARRATPMLWRRVLILWNFYPRPPRGGRRRVR